MDRRKENVPVPFDRRKKSDRFILWAVDELLKKAVVAQKFSNKESN